MATTLEKERQLQDEIAPRVEHDLPGVDVLAVELLLAVALLRLRRPSRRRRPRALRARHRRPARLPARVLGRGLLAGARPPAAHARALRRRRSAAASRCGRPGAKLKGEVVSAGENSVTVAVADGAETRHPVRRDRAGQSDRRWERDMSQEIIEAVREIERDKGIEEGALVSALEDALLAAYKKTPGASRHATVEMDDDGEFRVFSVELPRRRRGAPDRRGARAEARGARAARGGDRRAPAHAHLRRRPRHRLVRSSRETTSSART